MSEECFITSDDPKGFIEKVGKDYIIVEDIHTKEQIEIKVEEDMANYFKNECSDGEVFYVLYDKEKKELKL